MLPETDRMSSSNGSEKELIWSVYRLSRLEKWASVQKHFWPQHLTSSLMWESPGSGDSHIRGYALERWVLAQYPTFSNIYHIGRIVQAVWRWDVFKYRLRLSIISQMPFSVWAATLNLTPHILTGPQTHPVLLKTFITKRIIKLVEVVTPSEHRGTLEVPHKCSLQSLHVNLHLSM